MAWETEQVRLDAATVHRGVAAVFDDASKGAYWIARQDNLPVGVLMVTYEWSDWRNATVWWIQSVFVEPDYRRRGVFSAMYEALRQRVQDDASLWGLRLYVEENNQQAKQTYQRLGMKDCHYEMMQWKR